MAASIYVKKMYVITQTMSKWRHYLLGSHFVIKTDHKSLKHLLTQTIQTTEQQVFLCKLLGFDFTIVYKPGKENTVADALSRRFEDEEEVVFSSNFVGTPGSLLAISKPIYSLLEELKEENKKNPGIQKLLDANADKEEGAEGFMVRNGILLFNDRYYLTTESSLIKKILYEFHDSQLGAILEFTKHGTE